MIERLALVTVVALASSACAVLESDSTIVYQYVLRGEGDNVSVSYLSDGVVTEEEVSLPWSSEEFEGNDETPVRLEAEGPEGSQLTCVVRYRPIDGSSGGARPLEMSQGASGRTEDHTVCALSRDHMSTN